MSDYSELKRLAEAATKCYGAMRVEKDYNGVYQVVGAGSWKILSAWHTPDGKSKDNAEFYAAASPVAVLELIAEVDGLRVQHSRDSAELRSLCQSRDDARKERDNLKSELARLRAGGRVSKGELERLEEFKRQVRENRRDRF